MPKTVKKTRRTKTVTWNVKPLEESSSKEPATTDDETPTVAQAATWPPEITTEEATRIADRRYHQRLNTAIDNKLVVVLSSNLSEADKAILQSLSAKTLSGNLRLKTTGTADETTTICVAPATDGSNSKGGKDNLRTSARTLKVMLSALGGVPIVTPDWVRSCYLEKKLVTPKRFVRSLPTKDPAIEKCGRANHGVAKLAAALDYAESRKAQRPTGTATEMPFRDVFVYMCGKYTADKRKSLRDLLTAGGAEILAHPRDVDKRLSSILREDGDGTIAIVCGGKGGSGPGNSLAKPVRMYVKNVLEDALDRPLSMEPKKIVVVDSQWVIESVTCASNLSPEFFEPAIMKDLWKLSFEK